MEEFEEKNEVKKEKRKFKIAGITIGRLFDYFFIYSIVGYIIESLFGLVTKGVIESRQSFLYGPFCSIYGLGAIILIPVLKRWEDNNFKLFVGGFFVGSAVEYVVSVIGEVIFHIKWWDYSNMAFNINGRVCIAFSFFWGILAIILMTYVNPKVDDIINKIPKKYFRAVTITGIIILIIDAIVTGIALKIFFTRLVMNNNLELKDIDKYTIQNPERYDNEFIKYMADNVFTDEKILRTFPNIKLLDKEDNIIWVKDILQDIKPYYVKVFDVKR